MVPTLPPGWRATGGLPSFDPGQAACLTPEQLDVLREDLWQAERADGLLCVDLGWYPEASAAGRFLCLLVRDQDWMDPEARLETRSLAEALDWIAGVLARHAR